MVVVARMTAHKHHAIVRGTPANHFRAWPGDTPAIHMRLGFGPIAPLETRVLQHELRPGWNFGLPRPIRRPRLQHQDPQVWIAGQPVGQYTAGRSSADDDVVELLMGTHWCLTSLDPFTTDSFLMRLSIPLN